MTKTSILLIAVALTSYAQSTYYVSTTGSDATGNGSSATPWATIRKATDSMPDNGSSLIVRNGTYGVTSILRQFSKPVIIRAETPYQAKIRNADSVALSIYYARNVELTGFDIARTNRSSLNPLLIKIAGGGPVTLRNNMIHESYNNDLLKVNEGTRDLLIVGNTFRNQAGGAGQHIDVNGCVNVTIRENIFFNDAAQGGISAADINVTHGFIVVKNSSGLPESRNTWITSNVFLNFQGGPGSNFVLLGEDAYAFHETQSVLIENNLMLGNSSTPMRAPFGAKGIRDAIFRNNTVVGDLPGSAFAARFNREGSNLPNLNIAMLNNIWSDPTGTMTDFADGPVADNENLSLDNNLYWNNGKPIPDDGEVPKAASDPHALLANPLLPSQAGLVLPNWQATSFLSGTKTIREEFERLANRYGRPAAGSPAIARSTFDDSPETDLLNASRGTRPDLGAVQVGATAAPALRLALFQNRSLGGVSIHQNRISLSHSNGGTVTLTSSNSAASVPPSVTIAAGDTSASFTIATTAVSSAVPVTITATSGNVSQSATLQLVPQAVVSFNIRRAAPKAGDSKHYIMVEGPAASAIPLTLTSSRPDLITFPNGATVAAGDSFAEVMVRCEAIGVATPVTITASYGGKQASAILTFQPSTITLSTVTLASTTAIGATTVPGTVTLTGAAPSGGLAVSLKSSLTTAATVPASVTVPAGASSATFNVTTLAVTAVATPTITATYGTVSPTASLTVRPATGAVYPTSLSFAENSPGNTTIPMDVSLSGPAPTGGLAVSLTSTHPSMITLPATVTIPAGQNRTTVQVTLGSVTTSTTATISAMAGGVTVRRSITLSTTTTGIGAISGPASSHSGDAYFSISLPTPAPAGGTKVTLSASNPSLASVPASVVIPAGLLRANFTVTLSPVASNQSVSIIANIAGSSQSKAVTITPAVMSAVNPGETTIEGAKTVSNNFASFNSAAAAGNVILASSNPAVLTVPVSAAVTSGSFRVYFPVTTKAVTSPVTVTISATLGGVTKTATVTVTR